MFKSHTVSNIIIIVVLDIVTEQVWKCYRCDLTFQESSLANMHSHISSHPIRIEENKHKISVNA